MNRTGNLHLAYSPSPLSPRHPPQEALASIEPAPRLAVVEPSRGKELERAAIVLMNASAQCLADQAAGANLWIRGENNFLN